MDRFILISGCSGGGKSTLLAELARRGLAVVEEPGRRIIARELANGGGALPWIDLAAFARAALAMAVEDLRQAGSAGGPVVFDRGIVDAAAALQHATGRPTLSEPWLRGRYASRVFLTPPWPEIFVADTARRHDFSAAEAEYERLHVAYASLGYEPVILPKATVDARADLIVAQIGAAALGRETTVDRVDRAGDERGVQPGEIGDEPCNF